MKYKKLERDRKMLIIISCYIRNIIEVDVGKSWIMNQTVTKPVSKPKQPLEIQFWWWCIFWWRWWFRLNWGLRWGTKTSSTFKIMFFMNKWFPTFHFPFAQNNKHLLWPIVFFNHFPSFNFSEIDSFKIINLSLL